MLDRKPIHRLPATGLRRNRAVVRVVLGALLSTVALAPLAQQGVYDASEVKAAFLYHFGTYVQWPTAASAADPVSIAVLGDPEVAMQLGRFLPGRRIAGRPVQTREIARIEQLSDDELLFIGSSNNARLAEIIAAVARRPVLIVTDAPDGLERGAMVNFQEVDERVRFEISVPRAEEASLVLSSRLLSAALRVETSHCCSGASSDGVASAPARSVREPPTPTRRFATYLTDRK
jgi:hypothetical protein